MPVLNVRERVKNSGVWHDFKEFIQRGNIIDLGVVRYYAMATTNSSFTTITTNHKVDLFGPRDLSTRALLCLGVANEKICVQLQQTHAYMH
jgi:hypothetical protein